MAVRPTFYRTGDMRRPSESIGQTGLKDSRSDSQKAVGAELEAQPGFSLRLFWKWVSPEVKGVQGGQQSLGLSLTSQRGQSQRGTESNSTNKETANS